MTTAKVTPLYDFEHKPVPVTSEGFGHLGCVSHSLETVAAEFEEFAARLRAHAAIGGRLGMKMGYDGCHVPVIFPAGAKPEALNVGKCCSAHTLLQPTQMEADRCPAGYPKCLGPLERLSNPDALSWCGGLHKADRVQCINPDCEHAEGWAGEEFAAFIEKRRRAR